jgi:transcriptional regulator with XRE-family HTH domain
LFYPLAFPFRSWYKVFMFLQVRRARKEAGLTQEQLASAIGVTARAVAHWEAGAREPRGKSLKALAEATGKPISFFFEEVAA